MGIVTMGNVVESQNWNRSLVICLVEMGMEVKVIFLEFFLRLKKSQWLQIGRIDITKPWKTLKFSSFRGVTVLLHLESVV